jgi:putative flavoprotein involved in K+ transport
MGMRSSRAGAGHGRLRSGVTGALAGAHDSPTEHRVAVIGAGPAGLAVAAALRRRGVRALVIERNADVASSWRGHYERLHLHTPRWLSHLPGLRIPKAEGRWVSRDGVIRYLERYRDHHGLDVRTGTEVSHVDRTAQGWVLRLPQGDLYSRAVVVATGYNHTPLLPDWPGREGFTGELLHASRYRNGSPYRGRDVLVVGSGNTGAEIAVDVAEHGAARVRLAVRTPPHILRRELYGVPATVGGVLMRYVPPRIADTIVEPTRHASVPDLSHKGLPDPGKGVYTRARRGEIPILDVGLVDAILADRVEPVAAVTAFDGSRVLLAGGDVIEPEVVIAATGYRRGLESLVGHLGVLDMKGLPIAHGRRDHGHAPGLHFIGYTNPVSGMFREIGIDARRIASTLSARPFSTTTAATTTERNSP